MKSKLIGVLAGTTFACTSLLGVHEVRADALNFGTTYTNGTSDFATGTTINNTITLSSSAQPWGQGAQITEKTTLLGGGAEFVEFTITTSTAALLPRGEWDHQRQ
jgi:hypothetical protein